MKFFWFFFLSFSIQIFPQTVTKADFQILREDIREQNRILREDMNKRFEQVDKKIEILREDMNKRFEMMQEQNRILREDMNKRFEQVNKRFEDLFRFIGILYFINFAFLGYLWREIRKMETQKYNIDYLEEQIYQAKPEVKARIYFHIKEEVEKYKKKTSV